MKTEFTTLDPNDLHDVNGGRGQLIKRGAQWAWNNVIKPAAVWTGVDKAVEWATGGGQQPQQGQ